MRAAILEQSGHPLSVRDVEMLPPGADDVVVKIHACGVCHSDLSVARGYLGDFAPAILGHEATGEVVEVGASVSGFSVGDRVIGAIAPVCGHCSWCRSGATHLCADGATASLPYRVTRDGEKVRGAGGLGAFAEYMTSSSNSLVKVESDRPAGELALLGCGVTTGLSAVFNTAQVEPGTTVAVLGCGGVGQAVIQGAAIAGAAAVIAVDPVAAKREKAEQLGATHVLDPNDADPVAAIRDLTNGEGVQYAFEVIGLAKTIEQAYHSCRRSGHAVIVGMPKKGTTVSFDAYGIMHDAVKLEGIPYGGAQVRRDIPRYLGLVESKRLDLDAMISRSIELEEVNEAFDRLDSGEDSRSIITF